MVEVVVVGGGIAGCAVALELAARGAAVTVVDRGQPGAGATGASAGMVAPRYEAEGPSPLFRLALASREVYPAFVARLEELGGWPVGFRADGMLVANRTPEEGEGARAALAWQRGLGLPGDILEPAEAAAIHPGLSPGVPSWLWLPGEAQVDAQRLATALADAVRGAGARLLRGRPGAEVLHRGGRVAGVRLEGGEEVPADRVVVAAGAWSGTLRGLPRELPVRPVRGQILRLLPGEAPPWPLVTTHDGRYLVPRANGTVLVGSTMEEVGFDEGVTPEAAAELAEVASGLVPDLADARVVERWAGLRPLTPDGWPVLGPDPELDGLFYATGHGRNGILLAPVTGRIVADLVLERPPELPWEPFSVERFPGGPGG